MDLVNNIDPVASSVRILNLFPYITYVLHTVVGRGIYFHHIHGGTRLNGPAGGHSLQGLPSTGCSQFTALANILAILVLPVPCTAEQVSMATIRSDVIWFSVSAQSGPGLYILKGNRTPFAV